MRRSPPPPWGLVPSAIATPHTRIARLHQSVGAWHHDRQRDAPKGKLLGGQTALLSLRPGVLIDDLLLCEDPESHRQTASSLDAASPDALPARHARVCGGVKMANGTNPQGDGGDPKSRMGSAYLQRKALLDAKARSGCAGCGRCPRGGGAVGPAPAAWT